MSEKELHDLLLKEKPEGAQHDSDKCPICLVREASQEEKEVAEITQEQHEALLDTAVEKAKTEVRTSVDAEILSLNEQLAQAKEDIESKDETIAELQARIDAREESDRLSALAEERVELIRAADVNFSDEQIEARKESWASMAEEDFTALLEDYKAVATAKVQSNEEKPPKSSFSGTRETAGESTGPKALREFFGSVTSAAETV